MRYVVLLLSLFLFPALLSAEDISVKSMPRTADEFIALRNTLSSSPEGGAALFMVALITYVDNYDLGRVFFTIALDQSALSTGSVYKGYAPGGSIQYHLDRFKDPRRKRTPYAYIKGTSPDKQYAASLPYVFSIAQNKYSVQSDGTIKVYVDCSGASYPRPIRMKKNDKGVWKAVEFSSMFLDVQTVEAQNDDI
jgi:hypothetical protein